MRIFEVEKKDGLSPILHANASLSYTTKAEKTEQKTSEKLIEAVKSSIQPEDFTVDVYPFKSILATTIWNLNDDVFMPDEVWASRKSASNKPINIDHKKLNIIGHSLDALPYTEDGKVLEIDDDASLPNKFHLISHNILYRFLGPEEEVKEKFKEVEAIIAGIEDGSQYVSLEALLLDFDYAVIDSSSDTSTYQIVERNEETAFLSKYLKAYGGKGVYADKRIGRLCRDFIFCGQGMTSNPANPESVTFSFGEDFPFAEASLTKQFSTKSTKIIDMGYNEVTSNNNKGANMELEKQIEQLKSELDSVKAEKVKLEEKINIGVKSEINDLHEKVETLNSEKSELVKERDELKTNLSEVEAKLSESQEALTKLNTELVSAKRFAVLTEIGYDEDGAKSLVESSISLNDEQFDTFVKSFKSVLEVKNVKENKVESSVKQDDSKVLENVEANKEEDVKVVTAGATENKIADIVKAYYKKN